MTTDQDQAMDEGLEYIKRFMCRIDHFLNPIAYKN
jgi:hypothetical protein